MKRITASLGGIFRWVLQPLLVLVVLALGFFGAKGLSSQREAPARAETLVYAPLVRAMSVEPTALPVKVLGSAPLRARTRIDLVPQVGGEVLEIHPELRAGGRFDANEVLLRIEPVDYELAVAQARADVRAAETALTTLRAEAQAAVDEWHELQGEEPVPELVARMPQIQEAEARHEAAQASLDRASLNLSRTELRLPYAGRVVTALADVGKIAIAGQPVGSVYATDVFEVAVPLRQEQLRWIALPTDGAEAQGAIAIVRAEVGNDVLELTGRVVRLEAEHDSRSRFARVVVEVRTDELPVAAAARLLPGLFVRVELDGGTLENVVALPRGVLRENDAVWIERDGRLRMVPVEVRHADGGEVFVEGIPPGSRVITSELEVVTNGMQVRIAEDTEAER